MTSLLLTSTAFAKKRCKPFLEKLHKVQATQRSAYSLKRGESLRAKEDKVRDQWWQCENSSLAKFNAKYGKNKKKKSKDKKLAKSKVKSKKTRGYNTKLTLTPMDVTKSTTSFNQHSAIVIKSKYQGEKQLAWLAYYQKPTKCHQPNTMSAFAFCHEHKRQQQSEFDKAYQK